MSGEGFTCLEAPSGVEALEHLKNYPVSLVLTDMRMPNVDGIELLRRTRESHPEVAVILITAVAEVEVALSCLSMGAMDYLTKPFHLEEVRARVGQAMEKRRLIIENRMHQERLEERVKVQAERIERLFLAGIQSLVFALEAKDQYTRGHSIRVSRYCEMIAWELGLEAEIVRQVELGGQVHDIGKIGVREAVLNKGGPLTAEEYEHIMTHPTVGWRMLSPLLTDAPVALNIVRLHHEKYDGSGRPEGLAGEQIPLEARIAAVADAFDAMTSGRAYKRSLSLDDAIGELRRGAGSQFDPKLIETFIGLAQAGAIARIAATALDWAPVIERSTVPAL
jgi:putative two-component system response regulator